MVKTQNIFTVDVEEYYHAENILRSLAPEKLKALPDRVEVGVGKILDLLAKHDSHATFFVLGCLAAKEPALIRRIAAAGHEISSHGYEHTPLTMHTPQSFDADLGRSVMVLENIVGTKVIGYRATSFSLTGGMTWFFDVLRKHGIRYDSSIALSFFRPHASVACGPYEVGPDILEFPISTLTIGPCRVPVGGGYFRAYPLWMTKIAAYQAAAKGVPFIFYLHPWELDPGQPRVFLPREVSFRHYYRLDSTAKKVDTFMDTHTFNTIKSYV